MKKICIFYFSGTGFTERIVNSIKNKFMYSDIVVSLKKIEETKPEKLNLGEYDMVGISYPVHAFNAPEIVVKFCKNMPKQSGLDTFIVFSAGEDSKMNYSSSRTIMKILKGKGYNIIYDKLIRMPSNFMIRDSDEMVEKVLRDADKNVDAFISDIAKGKSSFIEESLNSKFMAAAGKAEWFGARIIGKFYYSDNNCTQCKVCIKKCPNKNISLYKNGVKFGWQCSICMRCVYSCPVQAIDIKHPFKFIKLNSWYDNDMSKN